MSNTNVVLNGSTSSEHHRTIRDDWGSASSVLAIHCLFEDIRMVTPDLQNPVTLII